MSQDPELLLSTGGVYGVVGKAVLLCFCQLIDV